MARMLMARWHRVRPADGFAKLGSMPKGLLARQVASSRQPSLRAGRWSLSCLRGDLKHGLHPAARMTRNILRSGGHGGQRGRWELQGVR